LFDEVPAVLIAQVVSPRKKSVDGRQQVSHRLVLPDYPSLVSRIPLCTKRSHQKKKKVIEKNHHRAHGWYRAEISFLQSIFGDLVLHDPALVFGDIHVDAVGLQLDGDPQMLCLQLRILEHGRFRKDGITRRYPWDIPISTIDLLRVMFVSMAHERH
jgi:hypothetical protein